MADPAPMALRSTAANSILFILDLQFHAGYSGCLNHIQYVGTL